MYVCIMYNKNFEAVADINILKYSIGSDYLFELQSSSNTIPPRSAWDSDGFGNRRPEDQFESEKLGRIRVKVSGEQLTAAAGRRRAGQKTFRGRGAPAINECRA